MKIFVTGASGWIGSAVVPELLESGHEVVGLARSDASAQKLETAGATVQRGDLDDPETLAKTANDADGVIHLAFQHEIAFGGAILPPPGPPTGGPSRRWARPWPVPTGPSCSPPASRASRCGRPATEDDGLVPSAVTRAAPPGIRQATALLALSLRGLGVRSSVLRFAPTVHGDGDQGFIATYVGVAREKGMSGYVGDGAHRWPAVHRSDAARLARLAVEAAPAGSVLHAVGEEGVLFRDIAEAIGRGLGVPTGSIAPENALDHFGPLGLFAGMDFPATAAITQELLGWKATGPTLIEDLDQGHYFRQD